MSKRIMSLVMGLIIATSLIGCGGNGSKDSKSQGKANVSAEESKTEDNEDSDLEGTWAENYTLEQTKGFYKEYLKKMEDITKGFGLKYEKDEKIREENDQKVNDDFIYYDNEKPEANKIESMYFGMKTYGDNLEKGDISLKLSLNFDGESAIKNNDFDLGKTAFDSYIKAFTGKESIDYSKINKEIIDGLKEGKTEVDINNTIDGLKEEIIATKDCIIYKLSTKKYTFADAEMSME